MWEGECVEKMTKPRDGGEREREGGGGQQQKMQEREEERTESFGIFIEGWRLM